MPRLLSRKPPYCLDAASGRAYVKLNGERIYLGDYNSDESREAYARTIGEWIPRARPTYPDPQEFQPFLDEEETRPEPVGWQRQSYRSNQRNETQDALRNDRATLSRDFSRHTETPEPSEVEPEVEPQALIDSLLARMQPAVEKPVPVSPPPVAHPTPETKAEPVAHMQAENRVSQPVEPPVAKPQPATTASPAIPATPASPARVTPPPVAPPPVVELRLPVAAAKVAQSPVVESLVVVVSDPAEKVDAADQVVLATMPAAMPEAFVQPSLSDARRSDLANPPGVDPLPIAAAAFSEETESDLVAVIQPVEAALPIVEPTAESSEVVVVTAVAEDRVFVSALTVESTDGEVKARENLQSVYIAEPVLPPAPLDAPASQVEPAPAANGPSASPLNQHEQACDSAFVASASQTVIPELCESRGHRGHRVDATAQRMAHVHVDPIPMPASLTTVPEPVILPAAPTPLELPEIQVSDPIPLGTTDGADATPIEMTAQDLCQHIAFVGAHGSGKTTAALAIIENLLLRGIPAILLDRKGDLARYGDPGAWVSRGDAALAAQLQRLQSKVEVAIYTPGSAMGRPLAASIVPDDIHKLSAAERSQVAQFAAASIGAMAGYRTSAGDIVLRQVLTTAIEILAAASSKRITVEDLRHLIASRDRGLLKVIGTRASDKEYSRLSADLQTVALHQKRLLASNAEPLDIDALLGRGPTAVPGKTRLSIIHTGSLGSAVAVEFWISQLFLAMDRWRCNSPSDTLQAAVFLDEVEQYLPAARQPTMKAPLEALLKQANSAGLAFLLATQTPAEMDFQCRGDIATWMIGKLQTPAALNKVRPLFSDSTQNVVSKLGGQKAGEFFLVCEDVAIAIKATRSLIESKPLADQRIAELARARR